MSSRVLQLERLQDLLLLGRLDVEEAGDEIGELARRLDAIDHAGELGHRLGQQPDGLDRVVLQNPETGLELRVLRRMLSDQVKAGREERHALDVVQGAEAPLALADDVLRAVTRGEVAHDAGNRANRVQVGGLGLVDGRVALHDEPDLAAAAACLFRGGQRDLAPDRQRDDGARKHHGVAHRQDDQHILRDIVRATGPDGRILAHRARCRVLEIVHCRPVLPSREACRPLLRDCPSMAQLWGRLT